MNLDKIEVLVVVCGILIGSFLFGVVRTLVEPYITGDVARFTQLDWNFYQTLVLILLLGCVCLVLLALVIAIRLTQIDMTNEWANVVKKKKDELESQQP